MWTPTGTFAPASRPGGLAVEAAAVRQLEGLAWCSRLSLRVVKRLCCERETRDELHLHPTYLCVLVSMESPRRVLGVTLTFF